MRKYAILLLVSGGSAVGVSALLTILAYLSMLSQGMVIFCIVSISILMAVAFYALAKLAQNGLLMTDLSKILKL